MIRNLRATACGLALAAAAVALPSAQRGVPTPQSVLGWDPCADYKLATYEQIEDYFRKLAAAAPNRMKLVEMGKTAEGRTQVLAIISSEDNIRQLGKYKDIARKLALVRDGERSLTMTRPARWRATARRSCGSTSASTRPRSRMDRPRRSWRSKR